jgi:hypothetical protein
MRAKKAPCGGEPAGRREPAGSGVAPPQGPAAPRALVPGAPGLAAGRLPPLRSLEVAAHNLPIQLTGFIRRAEEMAEVRQQLSEGRLVTLTGAGGCGKTRLALQVAAEQVGRMRTGSGWSSGGAGGPGARAPGGGGVARGPRGAGPCADRDAGGLPAGEAAAGAGQLRACRWSVRPIRGGAAAGLWGGAVSAAGDDPAIWRGETPSVCRRVGRLWAASGLVPGVGGAGGGVSQGVARYERDYGRAVGSTKRVCLCSRRSGTGDPREPVRRDPTPRSPWGPAPGADPATNLRGVKTRLPRASRVPGPPNGKT